MPIFARTDRTSGTGTKTAMKLIVLLAMYLFAVVCADPISDFQAAVVVTTKEYMEAWGKKDSHGVANCYAEDGIFLAPGRDVLRGRKEIAEFVETLMMKGMVGIQLEGKQLEVFPDGQVGYNWGYHTFLDENGIAVDHGKNVAIGKMVDGEVKITISIFNSNSDPTKPRDEL